MKKMIFEQRRAFTAKEIASCKFDLIGRERERMLYELDKHICSAGGIPSTPKYSMRQEDMCCIVEYRIVAFVPFWFWLKEQAKRWWYKIRLSR